MLNKMGIGLTKWLCMAAMLLCLNTAGFASWGMAFAESDENIGNSLDGTTIEALTVQWITHDSTKTAAGADAPETTAEHLYLSATDNAELPMIYRIETSMSGQYNYAPGDITITIPAKVWRARTYEGTGSERAGVPDDANLLGYMEVQLSLSDLVESKMLRLVPNENELEKEGATYVAYSFNDLKQKLFVDFFKD